MDKKLVWIAIVIIAVLLVVAFVSFKPQSSSDNPQTGNQNTGANEENFAELNTDEQVFEAIDNSLGSID